MPGETDLRVFTTEVVPAGRHRFDGSPRLAVEREPGSHRPVLRPRLSGVRPLSAWPLGRPPRGWVDAEWRSA